MIIPNNDPLWHIAERVADCFSGSGYAFIEDDKIESLAAVLHPSLRSQASPSTQWRLGRSVIRGAWPSGENVL